VAEFSTWGGGVRRIRWTRTIVFDGPEDWVLQCMARSPHSRTENTIIYIEETAK
jgi:hypothetical protein